MATTRIQKEYLDDELVEVLSSTDASTATPTPTGNAKRNFYTLTALATNATIAAPSGTAVNGNMIMTRIKDNGTARTLARNAIFRAIGVTPALTTVINKTYYELSVYNSADTKWGVISTGVEA